MPKEKIVICFGEVLWDNLPSGRKIGGAPLNVCYHLLKSGIDHRIISQVGEDKNGMELMEGIKSWGINVQYCSVSKSYPTSTVEVHLGELNKISYEIVEQVAWDYIEIDERVIAEIKEAAAFIYGSLAARNKVSRETLLHYLSCANWAVFDINLRAPFYTRERIIQLLAYCRTLKVNDEEIEILSDWFGVSGGEKKASEHLFGRFDRLQEIIITKGARGVSYYSVDKEIHLPAISVTVADTVGSGDAFLAAYVSNRLAENPVQDCLEKAIALSAFVATKKGGTPPYEMAELKMNS